METKKTTILSYLALIALSAVLMSCGASKTEFSSLSSRSNPLHNGGTGGTGGLLAECTGFQRSDLGLTAHMWTYYNPNTGMFVGDYVTARFHALPGGIVNNSNHYMQVFRWSEDVPGSRATNQTPVSMYFVERGTGRWMNGNEPATSISRNTIESVISKNGLGSNGISVSNFFSNYDVVLTGMDLSYDAVVFALYDQGAGSHAYGWADALIPAFEADPNRYAASHAASSLQQLHPMMSRRASGLNEASFLAEMNQYCQ